MKTKEIKLNKTQGKKTIAQAKDVFTGWIDSGFKNYGTDKPESSRPAQIMDINQMEKDGMFKDIFTDPDNQTMTQEQIIEFCQNHKEELQRDYFTFFLFKVDTELSVVNVVFDGRGRLEVYVDPFSDEYVWGAGCRHLFVTPQQSLENLEPKKTLDPLETSILNAIKLLKENGYKITKEF